MTLWTSFCHLRPSLENPTSRGLDEITEDETALANILSKHAHVVRLFIKNLYSIMTQSVFQLLRTKLDGRYKILPQLEELVIVGRYVTDYWAVVDMIKSRCQMQSGDDAVGKHPGFNFVELDGPRMPEERGHCCRAIFREACENGVGALGH